MRLTIATEKSSIEIRKQFGKLMKLHICGLDEIENFEHKDKVTHVLSLIDADYVSNGEFGFAPDVVTEVNHLFESFRHDPFTRLELKFDDVTYPTRFYVAPTYEDVEEILQFGNQIGESDTLLVHCHAGISRSTAAAALILLQAAPEKSATEIFNRILRIRPIARPNTLILELGGSILGRRKEIMDALPKPKFSQKPTWFY